MRVTGQFQQQRDQTVGFKQGSYGDGIHRLKIAGSTFRIQGIDP